MSKVIDKKKLVKALQVDIRSYKDEMKYQFKIKNYFQSELYRERIKAIQQIIPAIKRGDYDKED
jgi:hypothetical protein